MTLQRITFVSRAVAQGIRPVPEKALISIHDQSDGPMKARGPWERRLTLEFPDDTVGLPVFTSKQAESVLAFAAEAAETVEEIVVHCLYGQSRSAAIAMHLSEVYGVPLYQYRTLVEDRYNAYNRGVYAKLKNQDIRCQP